MAHELVVIWSNGEKDVYEYPTRDKAEFAGIGMETALGNQVAWWCVRVKLQ